MKNIFKFYFIYLHFHMFGFHFLWSYFVSLYIRKIIITWYFFLLYISNMFSYICMLYRIFKDVLQVCKNWSVYVKILTHGLIFCIEGKHWFLFKEHLEDLPTIVPYGIVNNVQQFKTLMYIVFDNMHVCACSRHVFFMITTLPIVMLCLILTKNMGNKTVLIALSSVINYFSKSDFRFPSIIMVR